MAPVVLGQNIPASFLTRFTVRFAMTVFTTEFTLLTIIMVNIMTNRPVFTAGAIEQTGVVSILVNVVRVVLQLQARATSSGMPTLNVRTSPGPLALVCRQEFKCACLTTN